MPSLSSNIISTIKVHVLSSREFSVSHWSLSIDEEGSCRGVLWSRQCSVSCLVEMTKFGKWWGISHPISFRQFSFSRRNPLMNEEGSCCKKKKWRMTLPRTSWCFICCWGHSRGPGNLKTAREGYPLALVPVLMAFLLTLLWVYFCEYSWVTLFLKSGTLSHIVCAVHS